MAWQRRAELDLVEGRGPVQRKRVSVVHRSGGMAERGIDQVRIAFSETLTIPWDSRQALLERLRGDESLRSVVDAFEAVGVSRPVTLSHEERAELSDAIRVWAHETGGYGALPEGIERLRLALVDENA